MTTIPRSFPRLTMGLFLLLCAAFFPLLSRGAEPDPGHLLVIKDAISKQPRLQVVRKWTRVPGSPAATAVNDKGAPVTIDTMALLWQVDLAALEYPNILTSDDLSEAKKLAASTATGLERFPQTAPYVAAPLTRLRADVGRAEKGDKKLKGKWYTPAQWAQFHEQNKGTISRGTLVLKNGTRYQDVEIITATPKELRIVHSDGAAVIPMAEVPVEFQKQYLKNLTPAAQ